MTNNNSQINEVKQEYADEAYKFLSEQSPGAFPFSDFFGKGNWRIVKDAESIGSVDGTIIGDITNFFTRNGHEISFEDGTTTYEYPIPAGPKQGQMTSSTSKIGKRINGIDSFIDNLYSYGKNIINKLKEILETDGKSALFEKLRREYFEIVEDYTKTFDKLKEVYSSNIIYGDSDLFDFLWYIDKASYPEEKYKLYRTNDKYDLKARVRLYPRHGVEGRVVYRGEEELDRLLEDIEEKVEKSKSDIIDWQEYWNINSKEIIENPDSVTENYKIIYSRHPIDVLRMADFENMYSCHSELSKNPTSVDKFYCAVAEMRANGFVAYFVEEGQLEEIDNLQQDEIFTDQDRDIPGVTPLARIKIRRIVDTSNDTELAIPGRSSYGENLPNMRKDLEKQIREYQSEIIEKYRSKGTIDIRDLILHGGDYVDNTEQSLIGDFFGDDVEVEGFFFKKRGTDLDMPGQEEGLQSFNDLADEVTEELEDMDWVEALNIKAESSDGEGVYECIISFNMFTDSDLLNNNQLHTSITEDNKEIQLGHGGAIYTGDITNIATAVIEKIIEDSISLFFVNNMTFRIFPHMKQDSKEILEFFELSFSYHKRLSELGAFETALDSFKDAMHTLDDMHENFQEYIYRKLLQENYFKPDKDSDKMLYDVLFDGENPFENFKINVEDERILEIDLKGEKKLGSTYSKEYIPIGTTFNFDKYPKMNVINSGWGKTAVKKVFRKKINMIYDEAQEHAQRQMNMLGEQGLVSWKSVQDAFSELRNQSFNISIDLEDDSSFSEAGDDVSGGTSTVTIYMSLKVIASLNYYSEEQVETILRVFEYFDDKRDEFIKAANMSLQSVNEQILDSRKALGKVPPQLKEGNTHKDEKNGSVDLLRRRVADYVEERIKNG